MKWQWTTLWMLWGVSLLVPAAWAAGPTIEVGDIADLDLARMSQILGEQKQDFQPL